MCGNRAGHLQTGLESDLHVETECVPPAVTETAPKPVLPVETFGLKACSVRLVSLEDILFSNKDDKHPNKTEADPKPQSDTTPKPPADTPAEALGEGSATSDSKGQKREIRYYFHHTSQ